MSVYYKDSAYRIIGCCMEVHKQLGKGFLEIVYKDALELELKIAGIDYEREREFKVIYKEQELKHKFYADFVINGNVILEAKAVSNLVEAHYSQTLNYLNVSGFKLGLFVNFANRSLEFKRFVL